MKNRLLLSLALAAAAVIVQLPARAATITVPNFSFEANALGDGVTADSTTGGVPNWTLTGFSGVYNPTTTSYSTAGGNGTPTGADGREYAFTNGPSSFTSAASLGTVQANSTYSLTVAFGNALDLDPSTVRVGLLFNDSLVTTGQLSYVDFNTANYASEGTFRDYTFNYGTKAADVGKTLKIFFQGIGTEGVDYAEFDNVRLSVTATPEPSTYAMMALGLGAMGLLAWKRKKNEPTI